MRYPVELFENEIKATKERLCIANYSELQKKILFRKSAKPRQTRNWTRPVNIFGVFSAEENERSIVGKVDSNIIFFI